MSVRAHVFVCVFVCLRVICVNSVNLPVHHVSAACRRLCTCVCVCVKSMIPVTTASPCASVSSCTCGCVCVWVF